MKRQRLIGAMRAATAVLVLAALSVLGAAGARAQDVREAARKAEADRAAAVQRAREVEQGILADRERLLAEVRALEAQQRDLEADLAAISRRLQAGEERRQRLTDDWARRELGFKEISGNVIVVARDLETMLADSPLSAGRPERAERIAPLLRKGYFPGVDDISAMADVFLDEIARSGQVRLEEGEFVNRAGQDTRGPVLTLGKFTAVYQDGGEVGFLKYAPEGQRHFALSALPPRGLQRQLRDYLKGASAVVPIDLSSGAALRQVARQENLVEHVRAGGPIVWPILLIALIGVGLIIHKSVFLNRVHGNTDRVMTEVNDLADRGDWSACEKVVQVPRRQKWPVIAVIKAGLAGRSEERETLESILQESILHELPQVQKGLSTLAIFAAVAPLLGLLGTVTGMIQTFRVITLYGTGDPKLMSGGISEALVTTEIGLAVAIPFMLAHTFLSRKVDHIVGDMEKNAVRLTNIIQKERMRRLGGGAERSERTLAACT